MMLPRGSRVDYCPEPAAAAARAAAKGSRSKMNRLYLIWPLWTVTYSAVAYHGVVVDDEQPDLRAGRPAHGAAPAGTVTTTVVPSAGELSISSVPPTRCTRERMLTRP